MDFRVYKSADGQIVVKSKSDDFVASYRHGEWVNDMMFDPTELYDLPQVEDLQEVNVIVSAAKKALSRW